MYGTTEMKTTNGNGNKIDFALSKEEKLELLKQKKEQKELKIKSKLDIYTNVRPSKLSKDKDKITNEYYALMQRQQ